MSKREANNILVQLRLLGYTDAELLILGEHRKQFAVRLHGYGVFHRAADFEAWKERIGDYKGEK